MSFYLNFSDSAKFADVARNLVQGNGYHNNFAFFLDQSFDGRWISPAMPYFLAMFMKVFGVNDLTVIVTSFFFFLLTVIFTYVLAKKLTKSNLIGLLSALAVGFNQDLIKYAVSGASESLFILEIVAVSYFITLKSKIGNSFSVLVCVLMYFTRPQAFIYISGLYLYYLLLKYDFKRAFKYFAITVLIGIIVDKYILSALSGKYFIYSVLSRGSNVLSQVGVGESASNQLRSNGLTYSFSIADSFKKLFYNIYNFYKLLPQIVSPYLFSFFLIGLFRKGNREFKIASSFIVLVTLLVAALSIPFFRYIHPAIPLIYIVATIALNEIIANKKLLIGLVGFFALGQSIGVMVLDTRFEKKYLNTDKPPVYVLLSEKLKTDTNIDDFILTNLDTWGSWYGERKTIWFPLTTKMLSTSKANIKYIYLTSYKIDDENYYMGESWREIFNDPMNQTILPEYKLLKEYKIEAVENYENETARAILLVKNE